METGPLAVTGANHQEQEHGKLLTRGFQNWDGGRTPPVQGLRKRSYSQTTLREFVLEKEKQE
jgi:hypothetical protein